MTRRAYHTPVIQSMTCFETSALACGKTTDPPPGSWHFGSAYDTFTGHFGGYMGTMESLTGSTGVGFGPGGSSFSYIHPCGWVLYSS